MKQFVILAHTTRISFDTLKIILDSFLVDKYTLFCLIDCDLLSNSSCLFLVLGNKI